MISFILLGTIWRGNCHSLDSANGCALIMESIRNFICLRNLALLSLLVVFTAYAAVAADVHGTVTNAQGGEPLGKIHVAIVRAGLTSTTVPDGIFHLAQLSPASYVLQLIGAVPPPPSLPSPLPHAPHTPHLPL